MLGDQAARVALSGPDMPRPLGPYSPAVRAGNLIFVSGQAGIDPATDAVPPGAFEHECRQAFTNVQRVLRAADVDVAQVVRAGILYVDENDIGVINKVFEECFPLDPPARTAAIVKLPAGRRVSIDVIAAGPGPGSPTGNGRVS